MPNLTVPEEYIGGLSRVLGLTVEESKRIAKALESAKTTNLKELTEIVALAIPEIKIKEAREIVTVLRSLYSTRNSMEITVEEFVKEILRAARQKEIVISVDSDEQMDSLRGLLNVRPLSMISKARGLHIEHENVFCSARIMSDLRPVFDINVEEEPTGFVMAHILKLGFHRQGKHKEFYVAMDKLDIQSLVDSLQRAQTKAATLHKMSKSKELAILGD